MDQNPPTVIGSPDIWDYFVKHNIWLNVTHLTGCENTEADTESRHFNGRTEWMLHPDLELQPLTILHPSLINSAQFMHPSGMTLMQRLLMHSQLMGQTVFSLHSPLVV